MLAEPAFTKKGLKRMNDPFWEPLWACCEDLAIPMHWHGSSGLVEQLSLPKWHGFTKKELHTVSTSRLCATPAQLIPNLIFSGILDRYPKLRWACAETGFGWVSYVLEASGPPACGELRQPDPGQEKLEPPRLRDIPSGEPHDPPVAGARVSYVGHRVSKTPTGRGHQRQSWARIE